MTLAPKLMLGILHQEAVRRINRELKELGAPWGFVDFQSRPDGLVVGITSDGAEAPIAWGAAEFGRTLEAIHTLQNFFKQRP
jgi:hypothetical protein